MADTPNNEYCILSPDFPKSAYLVYLLINEGHNLGSIIPLLPIYTSYTEISLSVKETIEQVNVNIDDINIIIPLEFQSLCPLKKIFWKNPTINYDIEDRIRSFISVAAFPEFHKILVTPSLLDKVGNWHLNAALPLNLPAEDKVIERFMLNSNWPVCTKAKYAAIYTCGKPSSFNWKTQEIFHLTQSLKIDFYNKN